MRTSRHVLAGASCIAAALVGLFTACGNSGENGGSAGGAGSGAAGMHSAAASSGGSAAGEPDAQAGTGAVPPLGEAGVGPSAGGVGPGSGGDTGSGSVAGEGGAGNDPGAGGAPPGGPECTDDEDCAVFDDCCSCAVGPAKDAPAACEKLCIQSACQARGISAEARCRSHRCVFDLSCDAASVTCKVATPECKTGQVPSVIGTCYGPCIDVAQCRDVTNCKACRTGQVCVQNQDSPQSFSQCVSVERSCAANPSCACADACSYECNDTNGIACFCPIC